MKKKTRPKRKPRKLSAIAIQEMTINLKVVTADFIKFYRLDKELTPDVLEKVNECLPMTFTDLCRTISMCRYTKGFDDARKSLTVQAKEDGRAEKIKELRNAMKVLEQILPW
jgi:hypothetical protein